MYESITDFSPLTVEGCLRSGLATDVDVFACMLYRCAVHVTHKSAFSPLHYRDIDAVGGTSCDAFRGDPKVSWASELCSGCRLYPSQSHLQLERAGSEKKKSNRGIEKKRQSYRN